MPSLCELKCTTRYLLLLLLLLLLGGHDHRCCGCLLLLLLLVVMVVVVVLTAHLVLLLHLLMQGKRLLIGQVRHSSVEPALIRKDLLWFAMISGFNKVFFSFVDREADSKVLY